MMHLSLFISPNKLPPEAPTVSKKHEGQNS